MLKKFLTAAYLLTLTATPTQALPIWAESVARSQCQYLYMGIDWETATDQALRDNAHWSEEFRSPVAAKAIVYAAYELCPAIFNDAFLRYEAQQKKQPTPPAINQTGESLWF